MINKSGKTITILGSTGSIGTNTIEVIKNSPEKFSVIALTANSNAKKLAKQAIEVQAKHAFIKDERKYSELKELLKKTDIQPHSGTESIVQAAKLEADIVMSSIVGIDGMRPTMAALKRGCTLALANKESLVCAGELMINEAKKSGSKIIPVDSEHNAIFQIFDFDNPNFVEKIILTASGGPFRGLSKSQMQNVTPAEAVSHPNWDMGAKISVDSATMVNKGLEMIEAFYLFPITKNQIEVIVHPESIIHSFVEYKEGSILAQLGTPDMRTPISVALNWPKRDVTSHEKFSFSKYPSFNFEEVNHENFEAIKIAQDVIEKGGIYPCLFNIANEYAVDLFLKEKIRFLDIITIIKSILNQNFNIELKSINDTISLKEEVRLRILSQ